MTLTFQQPCRKRTASSRGLGLGEYAVLVAIIAIGTLAGLSNLGSTFNTTVVLPGTGIITGAGAPTYPPPNTLSLVFGWNTKPETGGGASCDGCKP